MDTVKASRQLKVNPQSSPLGSTKATTVPEKKLFQKNMVLTRTSATSNNNTATLTSTNNNNNNNKQQQGVNNMISFETRGSTSFDAREKKLGNKYAYKNRNHGREEFIMLQRPTPIILAKPNNGPTSKDQQQPDINKTPSMMLQRHTKDENSKPPATTNRANEIMSYNQQRSAHTSHQASGPTLLSTNQFKAKDNKNADSGNHYHQPILANLSTNLKSVSVNKMADHQRLLKSDNVQVVPKEAQQNGVVLPESLSARLTTCGQFMNSPVQVMDENLSWKEQLFQFLTDQPDFLVVGVLGKRGCGKSTLMSLLAGQKFEELNLFKTSSKETEETAQQQTAGIQAFVTAERTILLDVQPLLSSSGLDKAINSDKKHLSNDSKYYENFIEMQSIELACFILSVSNVVLVTEDWFVDPNLFRILQTAEMLMPSNIGEEVQWDQKYPHLVYVYNKGEQIEKGHVAQMKFCIENLMRDSKLVYKNSIREMGLTSQFLRSGHYQQRGKGSGESFDGVNLVVIPRADRSKQSTDFVGMPSIEKSIKYLTREILSIKRGNNPVGFTEKRWFSYASKVWDNIRKSPLITEYNRLMT